MAINYVTSVITTFYTVGADDQLFITSTGAMTFGNSIAISMNGFNSTVVNAGWVSSPNIAINTTVTSMITNTVSGVITSATSGINGNASSNLSLVNNGLISGTVHGVVSLGATLSIANAGMIAGSEGVAFTGQILSLSNSGNINGTSFGGVNVSADFSVNITNSGTISGRLEGISSFSTGTERIGNSGTISGATYAIRLGDNNSVVTNTGLIDGTTFLGGGTNYFYGARGIQGNVIGGAGLDFLYGGVGRDIFDGAGGANGLYGGAGDDEFSAGTGNDYFVMGADNDVVFGGGGQDSIFGGADDDFLFGDDGDDDIGAGLGDDGIYGGDGADIMRGSFGDDRLFGELAADQMFGGAGEDTISGAAGDDTLTGGLDDDRLNGGAGIDTFVFARGQGTDRIVDFQNGFDKLDLRAFDFASFAAVTAVASASSLGLRLDVPGEGMVFVTGLTLATFTATDVLL